MCISVKYNDVKSKASFESHLGEAFFVHVVHHDYLVIEAGGGASGAARTDGETEHSQDDSGTELR